MMTPPGATGTTLPDLDEGACNVVNSILNCRICAVSTLLKNEGVPEVEVEPQPPLDVVAPTLPETSPQLGQLSIVPLCTEDCSTAAATPELFSSPGGENDLDSVEPLVDLVGDIAEDGERPDEVTTGCSGPPKTVLSPADELYGELLNKLVILAAKMAHADFEQPSKEVGNDKNEISRKIWFSKDFWKSQDGLRKIGAAGELFVFEILSNLSPPLPAPGRYNRQSGLRHYVSTHDHYRRLREYDGCETADIVYDDESGALTNWFLEKGQSQATRMVEFTDGPFVGDGQGAVFAIFRVFDMAKASTGLEVYIDPEHQRRTGKLNFTATVDGRRSSAKNRLMPPWGFEVTQGPV